MSKKRTGRTTLAAFLRTSLRRAREKYYATLPVDEKLIVFEAFRSTKYADSPRAIYEYLLRDATFAEFKFVWVMDQPEKYRFLTKNDRTTIVKNESKAHYEAFARAKYWVTNGWIPLRIKKKPSQIALQCWHGTPLKRLRYDMPGSSENSEQQRRNSDEDIRRYDYLLSPSKFATRAFTSAFNLKKLQKTDMIVETGYPRNDELSRAMDRDRKAFRKKYDITENKTAILYAPTWRDDKKTSDGKYEYDLPLDFAYLRQKLGEKYVILFRAHNLVADRFDFSRFDGFVRNVSDVDDINELFIASDILVTDYSSVFFDYANVDRPIIFHMHDIEHYRNDLRGFYLDITDLPGSVLVSEEELVETIENIEQYKKSFVAKYKDFRRTYTYLDDGNATKRAVETLFS